ncbi:MAG: leucine-rich repeat protein, partial [Bacteroidaceae bacterium]|nr:leucine-rich repeat protein [Bacteroidaceae bacterium]
MKHLKHLFTALLLLCTTVVTAHDFEVGGIYYKIIDETNKTVAVTYQGASPDSYSGEYTGEISIPETVVYDGEIFRVVSIGEGAFFACPVLRIVIPNSVTNIEYGAFFNCQRLGSVTIPNGVTSIENCAFKQCYSLKVVCFEDGDSTLFLGVNSYNKDYIGGGLFEDCPLETLYLGRDLSYYTDGSCGYSPFYEKFGKSRLKTVIIGNSVTSIGEGAFKNCSSLTAVEIGNSVTNIGEGAFMNCSSLTGIEIGNSVTSIGEGAFMDCSSLAAVEIGNSLTSIGERAFDNCSALRLVINFSNLTFTEGSSDNGGVAYRALYVYNMPNGSIEGDFVFAKLNGVNTLCLYFGNEKELTLPADYNGGNYAIGNKAFFDRNGLTSITIPNSVTSIGD